MFPLTALSAFIWWYWFFLIEQISLSNNVKVLHFLQSLRMFAYIAKNEMLTCWSLKETHCTTYGLCQTPALVSSISSWTLLWTTYPSQGLRFLLVFGEGPLCGKSWRALLTDWFFVWGFKRSWAPVQKAHYMCCKQVPLFQDPHAGSSSS